MPLVRRATAKNAWATRDDVQRLIVEGREPGRVLIGRLEGGRGRGPALAAPHCRPVLLVGPTRSGKTTSVLVPAVVGWSGPVIATSIRADLLRHSFEQRQQAGWPLLVYNPKNIGDFEGNTWSPLVAAMGDKPWAGARRAAKALISASSRIERTQRSENSAFWEQAGADYLAPLLLAAAGDGPSMAPVMKWLQEGDDAEPEVRQKLAKHPDALRAAEGTWGLESRLSDSIYLEARTALSAYDDDDVLRTCLPRTKGGMPDITPENVLGSPATEDGSGVAGATLFVICPPTDWRYFAPLFAALITSIVDAAYMRAGDAEELRPPVLLALDEVANIAPIEDLPSWSSTAAGTGIQLVTALQDLGQAERIWGKEDTRTLLSNHRTKLLFGGMTDIETLRWAQEMVGEVEVPRMSETRSPGGRSRTEELERRPLVSTRDLREIPIGGGLVICEDLPPVPVKLTQWTAI